MSEDDDEYKYEYVNNTSNCKYAIYAVDAPPDEIAFNGKCFIYSKPDGFFTNKGFMSEILNNPTYLDLLHIADKEIETTQDLEHIYFEGMHVIKQVNNDLHQIELMLGS
jgi:hypothetical protein